MLKEHFLTFLQTAFCQCRAIRHAGQLTHSFKKGFPLYQLHNGKRCILKVVRRQRVFSWWHLVVGIFPSPVSKQRRSAALNGLVCRATRQQPMQAFIGDDSTAAQMVVVFFTSGSSVAKGCLKSGCRSQLISLSRRNCGRSNHRAAISAGFSCDGT